MSNYIVDSADLTSVANAIRTKGGTSASLAFPADFVSAIAAIPSGGGGNLDEIIERTATTISSNATDIKIAIAQNNSALESITFPEATKISVGYVFQNCSKLISVSMPKLANNSGYAAFQNCTSLEYVAFPEYMTSGANNMFDGCNKLKAADFGNNTISLGNASVFAQNYFNKCTMLTTLILRYSVVAKLGQINAFNQTPFASGGSGGTIYIPKSLYDHLGDGTSLDYKAATNWSTINGYGTITWAKIEGSQYENYYADGTPIT